ncbi:hypothetical protein GALL_463780 [mine drainage metagenome]|uniref:Uncharacterized protein n=1 Tax=mine drainage metagenome TaxID=410659 RepID=A0A1J5PWR9_9ZZZZ
MRWWARGSTVGVGAVFTPWLCSIHATSQTRTVIPLGGLLILGYQKSVTADTGYPASYGTLNRLSKKLHLKFLSLNATTARTVAGFGGRRFLVLQHEEAAKASRGAGKKMKRINRLIPSQE